MQVQQQLQNALLKLCLKFKQTMAEIHVTTMHMTFHVQCCAWATHNLMFPDAVMRWTSSTCPVCACQPMLILSGLCWTPLKLSAQCDQWVIQKCMFVASGCQAGRYSLSTWSEVDSNNSRRTSLGVRNCSSTSTMAYCLAVEEHKAVLNQGAFLLSTMTYSNPKP